MNGQQDDVRVLGCLTRGACPRIVTRAARESRELVLAARVAEDHLMSGAREERPELTAHQPGTQNPNSHATRPS